MERRFSITIYHDTRRKKVNNLYPVKIRVYYPPQDKTKFYSTALDLTKEDFKGAWTTNKPKPAYQNLRLKLQALEGKANGVAEKLFPFDFEKFERALYREASTSGDAVYFYGQTISRLNDNGQIGSAISYQQSLNSLLDFAEYTSGSRPNRLFLSKITPEWLTNFEQHMIKVKGRSQTTVAIYLRTLRAIFNTAIAEGEIHREQYPFGRKKYIIPAVKNIKKALDINQLSAIYSAKATTPEQEKARDFFLLSYACSGMNIKDIALLKWESIQGDMLVFYRAKTSNTTKSDQKPTEVPLMPLARNIIEKRGVPSTSPKDYVFDIISHDMSVEDRYHKIKNFTRFINEHIKKIAVSVGITEKISTYFARHSFASTALDIGMPLINIMESLGHNKITTTEKYLKSLPNRDKHREWMTQITNFKNEQEA